MIPRPLLVVFTAACSVIAPHQGLCASGTQATSLTALAMFDTTRSDDVRGYYGTWSFPTRDGAWDGPKFDDPDDGIDVRVMCSGKTVRVWFHNHSDSKRLFKWDVEYDDHPPDDVNRTVSLAPRRNIIFAVPFRAPCLYEPWYVSRHDL